MKRLMAAMTAAGFLLASGAFAAEVQVAAADKKDTFMDVIKTGGLPMNVIIGLSVLATFLVIFFLLTLRANALHPRAFIREAEDAAEEGDIEALLAICHNNGSMASRVIAAAAEQFAGDTTPDYMVVRDAIEDEGARQAGVLWQRLQYLLDISVVAPMVGLLGTVIGMLKSFSGLSAEVGVRPTVLAQGVAQALVTTAGGLVVGIAGMILYAVFRGRVSKLIGGLESACNRVLRKLVHKRGAQRY